MKAKPVAKAKPEAKSAQRDKKAAAELDDDELERISGGTETGKVCMRDLPITKKIDKASVN